MQEMTFGDFAELKAKIENETGRLSEVVSKYAMYFYELGYKRGLKDAAEAGQDHSQKEGEE